MKYTKYDKLIDESYPEERQAVYEKLKKELGLPDDTVAQKPASKWRVFLKQPARLAACVSAAVAVACLAIILPFTLNRSGSQTATTTPVPPSTSDDSEERFVEAVACKEIKLDCSLKEYSELNSLSLLYLDWYDVADIKTLLYVNKADSTDIFYYEEILKHKYTGSIAELYIADMRNRVDKLEAYVKACNNLYAQKDPHFKVYWCSDTAENGKILSYTAFFMYTKYVYVLVLRYPIDENEIFELIDTMLPEFKRQVH